MGSLGASDTEGNGANGVDSGSLPRPAFNINSIVIIGAGPSGLAAAKYLLAEGFSSSQIDIYEQQAEIGGVWNYSAVTPAQPPRIPQTDAHVTPDSPVYPPSSDEDSEGYEFESDEEGGTAPGSAGACSLPPLSRRKRPPIFPSPMYDDLYTNIPHPLMRYSDFGFTADARGKGTHETCEIFPSRQVVYEYLLQYGREVRRLILFSTQVTDVSLLSQASSETTAGEGVDARPRIQDQWAVRSINLLTGVSRTVIYDAVVVASGHYATPFIPSSASDISAFATAHPGVISHSKTYRTASPFAGKQVVVVGAGVSGLDIASQISSVCASPLIISTRSLVPDEKMAHLGAGDNKIRVVGAIERFLVDEKGIEVRSFPSGGSTEKITNIDAVLFCTGYLYSYPFFSPSSFPSSTPPLITDGRRVHGVARHFLHTHHSTLVFPGLPIKVIPFPLAEAQAAIFSRIWANRLPLPTHEELRSWELEDEEGRGFEGDRVRGEGKPFHTFSKGGDGRYINALHEWASRTSGDQDEEVDKKGRRKEPPFWGAEELWQRDINAAAKIQFEKTGRSAKTLQEIGFVYT
ncbi:FAD/NAD(P)-binding domain-containing protein [Xylaria nigripes]|nr:FAD/NAD(P)-binding domain-containing protein [Xylaria nigripes]